MPDRDDENERRLQKLRALAMREGEDPESDVGKTRTEARIDHIVGMMCGGAWVTGVSHRELGEHWNVSMKVVEGYAAEANRVIRRFIRENPEERADMLARLKVTFERLGQKAESRGSDKGYRDAIEAYKMLATLYGVMVQKVEVSQDDPFEGWSRVEMEHFVATGEKPSRLGGVAGDARAG
jgi:hypothetical protein